VSVSEFTPGPWFVKPVHGEANRSAIVLKDGKGGWVMVVQHSGEGVEERQQADAHLIAAAPDLLAACKEALSWPGFAASEVDGRPIPDGMEIWDRIKAAIAKAQPPALSDREGK
jgi:hypothetical protein